MNPTAKPAWLPSAKRHIERLDIGHPKPSSVRRGGKRRTHRGVRWMLAATVAPIAALAAGYVALHVHGIEAASRVNVIEQEIAPHELDAMRAIEREMSFIQSPAR